MPEIRAINIFMVCEVLNLVIFPMHIVHLKWCWFLLYVFVCLRFCLYICAVYVAGSFLSKYKIHDFFHQIWFIFFNRFVRTEKCWSSSRWGLWLDFQSDADWHQNTKGKTNLQIHHVAPVGVGIVPCRAADPSKYFTGLNCCL